MPEKFHILAVVLVTCYSLDINGPGISPATVLVLQQCSELGSLRHEWITYALISSMVHSFDGFIA